MKRLEIEQSPGQRNASSWLRQMVSALSVIGLMACDPQPRTDAPSPERTFAEVFVAGAAMYSMQFAQCHYDGTASPLVPALMDSPVLAEPASRSIDIILHGQQGVSMREGRRIGGIMPAQADLSDREIAEIVTYMRSEFAGIREVVSESDVSARR